MEEIDFSRLKRCAGANIRGTARSLSQFYDEILQPSGLRGTQFTLLVTIAWAGSIPLSQLAEKLVMDRTTLTRNLKPLEKDGLVQSVVGEDQRTRLVRLTEAGEEILLKALPLWEQAQSQIVNGLGQERFQSLLTELAAVRSLAK